jgi:integrase
MKGMRPLTDNEIAAVLLQFEGNFASRNKALFILGLRTGFRISELLSLRIRDVFSQGRIVDYVTVSRSNMKGKLEGRTIVLHSEAKVAICGLLAEHSSLSPGNFLFKSRKGNNRPITRQQAWGILEAVFLKAGLQGQLGSHSMRKSFAAKVHQRLGRDVFKTKVALGHKSIESTISYLSFDESEISSAVLSL